MDWLAAADSSEDAAVATQLAPERSHNHAATHQPSADEVVAALLAERRSRQRRALPRWTRLAMRALPRVLSIATLGNGLIGLVAVLAPLLRSAFGNAATAPLYAAYSAICPQRPSHTSFIAGQPMAMEQRMVAMYLAFGIAGLLYTCWPLLRRPLATGWLLLGIAPALVDVAVSSAGLRHSTAGSRWMTGAVASVVIVWWAYPRFDALLRRTQAVVGAPTSGLPTPRP
jgi:uncharacterized membrane protein